MASSDKSLFIKNAQVVNDDRIFEADIYIEDGVIKQLGTSLMIPTGVKTVDAKGKFVMPGAIDSNTHFHGSLDGVKSSVDLHTNSKAALAGGTTTIVDCVITSKGKNLVEAFDAYKAELLQNVSCNFVLRVLVPEFNANVATQMTTLVKEKGVNTFLVSTGYKDKLMMDDDALYDLMKHCKSLGALVQVHAENARLVARRSDELKAKGIVGPEGFLLARPEEAESEAVQRVITIADEVGCPVSLYSQTSPNVINVIGKARQSGKLVFADVLSSALAIDGHSYEHTNIDVAAACVTSPPLRVSECGDCVCKRLVQALAAGDVQQVGSGHSGFRAADKASGKEDFRLLPVGMNGGVEGRLSIVWHKAVENGWIDECKFVAVTSSNAAKMLNIYPKKGRVAVGSDADLIIWDRSTTRSNLHSNEGVDVNVLSSGNYRGAVCGVILAGHQVLGEDDNVVDVKVKKGVGATSFVQCAPFGQHVYGTVKIRDVIRQRKPVLREVFNNTAAGANITTVSASAASVSAVTAPSSHDVLSQQPAPIQSGDAPQFHTRHTKSGARNMQDSSFNFSGAQIDDDRPIKSSIRTKEQAVRNNIW